MSADWMVPGGIISLSATAADRLLSCGNGDAALLYLAALRHGTIPAARRALGWADGRADAALAALVALQLSPAPAASAAPEPPPEPDTPPDYRAADITQALEGDTAFAFLEQEVQRRLGKLLSTSDLKTLYELYDYLALPAEVILMLVAWCVEESGRKYGAGQKPRMSQIKKHAFAWRRMGVDTPEAAEDYLRGQSRLEAREREILPLLEIRGRPPLEQERRYIGAWVDWGFPNAAIRLAYERTVLKKQSLSWPYMNSILRNWHNKNLHTVAEIQRGDAPAARAPSVTETPAARSEQMRRDLEELFRVSEE